MKIDQIRSLARISLPCGAPRVIFMWLVETVLPYRQAILFRETRWWATMAVNLKPNKSGKTVTFCLSALDPEDRLRYPPVSLGFDMQGMSWLSPGVWENLFGTRFAWSKVGR